ncbi:hypothetical protein GCM10009647_081670 [Streptomyces sanglieri]
MPVNAEGSALPSEVQSLRRIGQIQGKRADPNADPVGKLQPARAGIWLCAAGAVGSGRGCAYVTSRRFLALGLGGLAFLGRFGEPSGVDLVDEVAEVLDVDA